jgi:hypothetical protein
VPGKRTRHKADAPLIVKFTVNLSAKMPARDENCRCKSVSGVHDSELIRFDVVKIVMSGPSGIRIMKSM